jgi:hypothetical protein
MQKDEADVAKVAMPRTLKLGAEMSVWGSLHLAAYSHMGLTAVAFRKLIPKH